MEFKVFQKELELQSRGWIPTFHDVSKEIIEIVEASGVKNGTVQMGLGYPNFWYGKNPVRMVIDKDLTLPRHLSLFDGSTPTIVFTAQEETPVLPQVEYITLDFSRDILPQIMEVLYQRKLQSLMVEGGSILLQSFIDAGCWDEAYIEQSDKHLLNGVKAPVLPRKYDSLTFRSFGKEIRYAAKTASEQEKMSE